LQLAAGSGRAQATGPTDPALHSGRMQMLRRSNKWVAAAVIATACASGEEPNATTTERDYLSLVVNGAPYVAELGRDSVLAVYNAASGQLRIEGVVNASHGGPALRLLVRCVGQPGPGVYDIRGLRSPVHAALYLPSSSFKAAAQDLRSQIAAYRSFSAMPGRLELETVNWSRREVRGRFTATLRDLAAVPVTVTASGTFGARLTIVAGGTVGGRAQALSGFEARAMWHTKASTDCGSIFG